jgi:hypothetical protein
MISRDRKAGAHGTILLAQEFSSARNESGAQRALESFLQQAVLPISR